MAVPADPSPEQDRVMSRFAAASTISAQVPNPYSGMAANRYRAYLIQRMMTDGQFLREQAEQAGFDLDDVVL